MLPDKSAVVLELLTSDFAMSPARKTHDNSPFDANDAPPVLFISGWGTTNEIWGPLLAQLPGIDAHRLTWADALDNDAAIATVLARRSRRWWLVGWSLGGLLALDAAIEHADRLAGLVLISATARMARQGDWPGVDARAIRAMRVRLGRDTQRLLLDFAGLCAAPDGGETVRRVYLDEAQTFSESQLASGLETLDTLDVRRRAATLGVPTWLLHGELDGVIPVESAQMLASMLPDARIEVFARRGHALPLTVPEVLADRIRGLL